MGNIFNRQGLKDIFISLIFAVLFSVIGVLFFALLVKFCALSDKGILIGNTVIKLLSVFFGIFFGYKNACGGAIKGAVSGILYVLISYFVFSLLSGGTLFAGLSIPGILFGAVSGIISGIIAVNIRK